MSISMEDVARRAGVSKSTVSLVLNSRPGVSADVRQRVQRAAQALGYQLPAQRSAAGQAASAPTAPVIALVHCVGSVPDVDPGLTHLYLAYRNGIQRFVQGQDVSVMLVTGYRDDNGDSLSYQLLAQEEQILDGLILMGAGLRRDGNLIRRVLEEEIPTVILGRNWPDLPISSVSQDHREQSRYVLEYLLSLGHQRIGFVAREIDRTYDWFQHRFSVYQQIAQAELGENWEQFVAIGPDVETAVTRLLAQQPQVTALFALNDHLAYQAIRAAIAAGRPVPDSLSVVGVDGTLRPEDDLPRLTTVAFPHEEVGYLAAEVLLKQIRNRDLRNSSLTVRSTLIEGASAARPADGA